MTAVYRAYDAAGRLLYVGVTDNIDRRIDGHSASGWRASMAALTLTIYPSRAVALAAERDAIRAERPLWNVMHSTDPEAAWRRSWTHRTREPLRPDLMSAEQFDDWFAIKCAEDARVRRIVRDAPIIDSYDADTAERAA
jgi:predicted GIY-YIG superfamily endonuclease